MGTLTPAIIGFLGALFGALIGATISMGTTYALAVRKEATEDRTWRRDRALEAYADVLKASTTIHYESVASYVAECDTEEQTKHVRLISAAVGELYALGSNKVVLPSPKEILDDLNSLGSYLIVEIVGNSLKCPKILKTEWDKILGADFIRVVSDFTLAARNDLAIHVPHLSPEQLKKFNQEWRSEATK
jgi:hypothetical protein